jgi:hypothetical protein
VLVQDSQEVLAHNLVRLGLLEVEDLQAVLVQDSQAVLVQDSQEVLAHNLVRLGLLEVKDLQEV